MLRSVKALLGVALVALSGTALAEEFKIGVLYPIAGTGAVYGTYETEPLVGDATLNFRVDATYTSSILQTSNPVVDVYPDGSNEAAVRIPSKWLLNGRIALRHIAIGGADAELALWGKNLTDNKDPNFILFTPLATSANFGPSRTYGVDLTIQF